MPRFTVILPAAFVLALTVVGFSSTAGAQSHDHGQHQMRQSRGQSQQTPLTEPGNDVFGTIQEVIRKLEANPETDWSAVDLEALRQHLIDMRNFTLKVDVVSRETLPDGLRLIVEANAPGAAGSLERVLKAHPPMLERETGWNMQVDSLGPGKYELKVTSPRAADAEKIQGLGYIGLMASGAHHQQHHWMIATGQAPHDSGHQ